MDPEIQLAKLKSLLNEHADLVSTIGLLHWDLETYMPPGGAQGRGHQLATLTRIAHNKFISDEVGQLLEDLTPYINELDQDSDDARLISVTNRLYKKRSLVPASLVAEIAKEAAIAHGVWVHARETSNFNDFLPSLEKIISLKRQYADIFNLTTIYDPLLDDYEPGLKQLMYRKFFQP